VHLQVIERILFQFNITNEFIIIGEDPYAGRKLKAPIAPWYKHPNLGFYEPAICTDVQHFVVIISAGWHTHLETYTYDNFFFLLYKFAEPHRRCPDEVVADANARISLPTNRRGSSSCAVALPAIKIPAIVALQAILPHRAGFMLCNSGT